MNFEKPPRNHETDNFLSDSTKAALGVIQQEEGYSFILTDGNWRVESDNNETEKERYTNKKRETKTLITTNCVENSDFFSTMAFILFFSVISYKLISQICIWFYILAAVSL